MRGLAYGFLLLAAVISASMAPLTRYTNASASQYTYHVVRSFSSMTFGLVLIATTQDGGLRQLAGTARTRPWFLALGASQWFFLWGFVHAMQVMTGATWATLHYCSYPIFATGIAFFAYSESPQWGYFAYTCCRNSAIIVLMMAESLKGGGGALTPFAFGFVMVTACSNGGVTAVLRNLKGMSPLIPVVWSDALNTVLWIPPGIFGARVPFLWPGSEASGNNNLDHNLDLAPLVWIGLAMTGVMGAGGIVCSGYALRYLDTAYVAAFAAPLTIIFSTLMDAILLKPPSDCAVAGMVCFCACSLVEFHLRVLPEGSSGSRSKDSCLEDGAAETDGERRTLLSRGGS